MSSTRRILVENVGDVSVVRFRDTKLIEDLRIQELGQELCELVEREPRRKFVLCFSGVYLVSSATWGVFIRFHKKVSRVSGRIVLCCLPLPLRSVLRCTVLDRVFQFAKSTPEAIEAFALTTSCPVSDCRGMAKTVGLRLGVEFAETTAILECSSCGACCYLGTAPSTTPVWQAKVLALALPTYDQERVLILAPGIAKPDEPAPDVYRIAVEGRLDLFCGEILLRAWRSVPTPRRVVFSLDRTTEVSPAGAATLGPLCRPDADGSRAAIWLPAGKQESAERLAVLSPCLDFHAALTALGEIPEEARRPLAVDLRAER